MIGSSSTFIGIGKLLERCRRVTGIAFFCILSGLGMAGKVPKEMAQIEFQFQIHPNLQGDTCAALPTEKDLSEEIEFPKLLRHGWVKLLRADYKEGRKFYPCFQLVAVVFPSLEEFHEFLRQAQSSPQYPFYSAGDYNLMTAIFEGIARSGDPQAYDLLLLKDTQNSASELDAPLYSKLRKNVRAYLTAFQKLDLKQKKAAVRTQYDFNKPLDKQIFDVRNLGAANSKLSGAAKLFNSLMRQVN